LRISTNKCTCIEEDMHTSAIFRDLIIYTKERAARSYHSNVLFTPTCHSKISVRTKEAIKRRREHGPYLFDVTKASTHQNRK